MKTADIKKGMRVMLSNGWEATILDNSRSVTRLAEVYGYHTEMGSVYTHDIEMVNIDGIWHHIALTDKQKQLKKQVEETLF